MIHLLTQTFLIKLFRSDFGIHFSNFIYYLSFSEVSSPKYKNIFKSANILKSFQVKLVGRFLKFLSPTPGNFYVIMFGFGLIPLCVKKADTSYPKDTQQYGRVQAHSLQLSLSNTAFRTVMHCSYYASFELFSSVS